MINKTITESDRMRIIESESRILLGERYGLPMYYEKHRVCYISLDASQPNYFADFDRERSKWVLTDGSNKRVGEFDAKSVMTRWVRKRIA